ncbi:hypothetical protein [uncultured Nostoc sp.]
MLTEGERRRRLGTLFYQMLLLRDRDRTQTICKISIQIKSDRIS